MTDIYLVRHGQASFGQKDYDNLSKLGLEQSYLLGQHFNHLNLKFDKIITGTLKRQIQTSNQIIDAANIKVKPQHTNLLNEYDVKSVLKGFVGGRNLVEPELYDKKVHFELLRNAVKAWTENKIKSSLTETWEEFEIRAEKFLNLINQSIGSNCVLVVSSGGTISMILKQILSLPSAQFLDFHFQIFNSSYSKIKISHYGMAMSLFNCIAHLESGRDFDKISYV